MPWAAPTGLVALAALLGILAFAYSLFPLWHTDIWGHLKMAEWMARYGELLRHEPFCDLSDRDATYSHFQWLTQFLFLGCYRLGAWLAGGDFWQQMAGGVTVLRTLTLVLALCWFWQLCRAYLLVSRSLWLTAAGLLLYVLLAPTAVGVLRPQVVGMVLFGWLLACLSKQQWTRMDVASMVLVLVLWANLHGSAVVGLTLICVFAAGRGLSLLWQHGWRNLPLVLADLALRRLLVTAFLAGLGVLLLNPHGYELPLHVLRFGRHAAVQTFDEFQPLNLQVGPAALFFYLGSVAAITVSWLLARWRPTATQLLILLAFALPPIFQRRMLMWWMPLVPYLLLPAWAALAERWRGATATPAAATPPNTFLIVVFALMALPWATARWLALAAQAEYWLARRDGPAGVATPRNTFRIVLVVLMVLPWTPPARWLTNRTPPPLLQSVTHPTPVELCQQLQANPDSSAPLPRLARALKRDYPNGRYQGRIFTSETLGDFMLWSVPEYPIVVYTHIHLFTPEHWHDCMTVKYGDPGWDLLLDGWKVNLIVVEAAGHPGLCAVLRRDERWSVVHDPLMQKPGTASKSPLFIALRKSPL